MRGLDGTNSTPTGCITGSGVIFNRGLGGGLPASMEKILKWSSGLIFDFDFSLNVHASGASVVVCTCGDFVPNAGLAALRSGRAPVVQTCVSLVVLHFLLQSGGV